MSEHDVGPGSEFPSLIAVSATATTATGTVSHGVAILRGMQRHEYAVVDACMRLHGCDTGSGDGIAPDERRHLIEWLQWRIDNWQPGLPLARGVDNAVYELAVAVVSQALDSDSDSDEEGGDV
jgi:hypothetical protein